MNSIKSLFEIESITNLLHIPKIGYGDIIEIYIIAYFIYQLFKLLKDTRAWMLFKGISVIFIIAMIASILRLNTIIWLFVNTIDVGIMALFIVFQPELRRALEQLGRKNIFISLLQIDEQKDKNIKDNDKVIDEIVKAVFHLAKRKTGALIVIEQEIKLFEYERTGIPIDAIISSQLIINVFEHNTPLHDGAVIIRNNRLVTATCYLPLSDNMRLSKELGTRHRAGLGISEVSDGITIIVSEETGRVSLAIGGNLIRNVNSEYLKNRLQFMQKKTIETKKFKIWKGRIKNDKKINK